MVKKCVGSQFERGNTPQLPSFTISPSAFQINQLAQLRGVVKVSPPPVRIAIGPVLLHRSIVYIIYIYICMGLSFFRGPPKRLSSSWFPLKTIVIHIYIYIHIHLKGLLGVCFLLRRSSL